MNRLNNNFVYVLSISVSMRTKTRIHTSSHINSVQRRRQAHPPYIYLYRRVTYSIERCSITIECSAECEAFVLNYNFFFLLLNINSSNNWHDHGESYCKQLRAVRVWVSVIRLNIFLSLFYIDAIGLIALLWPTLNFAAARFDIISRILIINSVSATLNNKNWFSMFFFSLLLLSST